MRSIADWCRHVALFYDSAGHYVGKKRLSYNSQGFTFLHRGYVFDPRVTSIYKRTVLFGTTKCYFYHLDNPLPLTLAETIAPDIDSSIVGAVLETDTLRKLNALANDNMFMKLLKSPMFWIILIVVIGGLYWYSTQGVKAV